MKVLHIIASVNPKTGGPYFYALNMAQEREARGHRSVFLTMDARDKAWVKDFPFEIIAAGNGRKTFAKAAFECAKECDAAVIHGLWNRASIRGIDGLLKARTPWVVFPHGMLDPYFRKIKPLKHIIKQVYWLLWQGRVLSGAHKVLFTSDEELRLAQGAFWGHQDYTPQKISYCAADQGGGSLKGTYSWQNAIGKTPYFVYLSRIHPKKGVDNLLEAFKKVLSNYPNLKLLLAGPDDTPYAEVLKAQSLNLGLGDAVIWAGMINGEEKMAAFRGAEAFVLPSHQENFGQVVAEALSAGTPALISRRVNIWREIVKDGAGLAGEDTIEDTTRIMQQFLALPEQERANMKDAARPCYEKRFSVSAAATDLETVLLEAVPTSMASL